MSETQSIREPKAENSVNASAVDGVRVEASEPKTAEKANFVETLRELSTSWAEVAIGYGRVALENVAHALERTAEKLGALQEKLKKADVSAAGAR